MNSKLRLFKRTLPPAAAPLSLRDILHGLWGIFNGRKEIERFRSEIKEYYDVKHCFLVSSGRAALTLVLRALHDLYHDRDEVIIPAYTCFSVPASIMRAGLKIRLCDIDAETLDFDFEQLNSLLSNKKNNSYRKRFLCIVPTHLFGLPSDINRVKTIIGNRDIPIVEDAAQAFGAKYNGRQAGTGGDVGFFSLGRGKAMTTGEGGIIVTNRDDVAERLKRHIKALPPAGFHGLLPVVQALLLSIFIHPLLFSLPRSLPFLKIGETVYDPTFAMRPMIPFQAGLTFGWRGKIQKFRIVRKEISAKLRLHIPSPCQIRRNEHDNAIANLIRFPVRIADQCRRRALLEKSFKKGFGIMPGYPSSVGNITDLASLSQQVCPVADRVAREIVTMPVHPFVRMTDIEHIETYIKIACTPRS